MGGDNLSGYFDAIYCINLKKRYDRKILFLSEMEKIGEEKNIIFFEGIEKEDGALGCLLSHREIVQIAKFKKYKRVLVFEDDAELVSKNFPLLRGFLNEMRKKKWSILYLGCSFMRGDLPYLVKSGFSFKTHGGRSSHAIAYNNEFYDKFLAVTNTPEKFIKKYAAIDAYLSLFGQEQNNAFMPLSPIFKQRVGFSSIEKKEINLDKFIINNFEKLSEEHFFFKKIKFLTRKIFLLIWKMSRERINMFVWSYKILFNIIQFFKY